RPIAEVVRRLELDALIDEPIRAVGRDAVDEVGAAAVVDVVVVRAVDPCGYRQLVDRLRLGRGADQRRRRNGHQRYVASARHHGTKTVSPGTSWIACALPLTTSR